MIKLLAVFHFLSCVNVVQAQYTINDPAFAAKLQQIVPSAMTGNVWPDDRVKYTGATNDRDAILQAIGGVIPTNTITGQYRSEDLNLDGVVKYSGASNDRDVILQTIGSTTPTAVRVEQVP